jgi:hypothetical protein
MEFGLGYVCFTLFNEFILKQSDGSLLITPITQQAGR